MTDAPLPRHARRRTPTVTASSAPVPATSRAVNGHQADPRLRSLTAASRRLDPGTVDPRALRKEARSEQAVWDLMHVPEPNYAIRFMGNSMSRLRLFPAVVVDPSEEPVPVDKAVEDPEIDLPAQIAEAAIVETDRMTVGCGGQSQLLARFGALLTAVGNSFVLVDDDSEGCERWEVLSRSNLVASPTGRGFGVKRSQAGEPEPVGPEALLYRIWSGDPQWPDDPDSGMFSVLNALEELEIYDRQFRAVGRSRTPAGLLLFPSELDPGASQRAHPGGYDQPPFPDPSDQKPVDSWSDFELALLKSFITPQEDDGSAASVVPHMIKGRGELLDYIRHIPLDRVIDAEAVARMNFLITRIAHGVNLPVEVLLGLADSNHWCKDESTEIYTRDRGWITHDELSVGDEVLTLDHDTGDSEWQPVQDIYRAHVVDEPMLSMEAQAHSSLSTGGHRWPIVKAGRKVAGSRRRWTTSAKGFAGSDRVPVAAPACDLPTEPKWDDDFVRLVAAWTSDGTVLRYESGTEYGRIAKFADAEISAVRRVLHNVFGPSGWAEHEHPTSTCTGRSFVLGRDAYQVLADVTGDHKAIQRGFVHDLTYAQRLLLLEAMLDMGDGVRRGCGTTFFQVEPSRLDAIELAAVTTGHKVTRGVRSEQTGYGTTPLSWIYITKSRRSFAPYSASTEWTTYTGTIWCPVTENTTWFARRNGTSYFTGNSAWLISDETYRAHIEPTAQVPANGLAREHLRPALAAAGLDMAWVDRITFGIDPSQLVVRPNRAQDARDAYDRMVISGEALRHYLSFPESDAPDEDELARRLTMNRGFLTAQMLGQMLDRTEIVTDPPLEVTSEAEQQRREQGGDGPPAEESGDPVDGGDPLPATEPTRALTAAAVELPGLGDRLATVEARLRDRLQVAASDSLRRALATAGNRLRTQVQQADLREEVNGQPAEEVGHILGEDRAPSTDTDLLLAGAFVDLRPRWDEWVTQAETEMTGVIAARLDVDPADVEVDTDHERGWEALLLALTALAAAQVFTPPPTPRGEVDASVTVPATTIRDSLAVAGGIETIAAPTGTAEQAGPPGLLTGPLWLGMLATLGVVADRWTWQAGRPSQPFPPHQELDGVTFESWEDPALANPDTFPPTAFYFPADHGGCVCQAVPSLVRLPIEIPQEVTSS